ncbi:MAG: sugar phosphate isomerase/epimerase [Candidatus Pacearchaeota archaeon]|nr:MAG: sugar phosphate isomerase/epimerase [Candidatus Pacearchaeota archaeon]
MPVYGRPQSYESLYTGTYSPLNPEYGPLFTGYRVPPSQLGLSTDPRTANIIGEVSTKLSQGIKTMELSQVSPQVFEAIPKQHWKEVERIGKLTGVDFTLHGPIVDPAGFSRDGWSESFREQAENQLKNAMDRAHDLSAKGNIPMTIHATGGVPSTEWRMVEGEPRKQIMYAVNRETGRIAPLEIKKRFFPKEEIPDPERELKEINERVWDSNRTSLIHNKLLADSMIKEGWETAGDIWKDWKEQKITEEELTPIKGRGVTEIQLGKARYEDVDLSLRHMFDEVIEFVPEEKKEDVMKKMGTIREEWKEAQKLRDTNPLKMAEKYNRILRELATLPAPETYVPAEDFCLDKSKKTIANVALHAYKEYGEKAPIISIENVFPNTVFGRAEELSNLIKESREEFIRKAKEEGMSDAKARAASEKLIGATWDVSHINMLRKHGFPKKAIIEETKKIAPYVKHVHLADNFGYEHVELPPGMGEVPIKEMLTELEKKGYSGKKILEFASWAEHMKVSPVPYLFEAMGSPLYGMEMPPFWNQVRGVYGTPAGYGVGFGMTLPEQHFATYGAGFSALPTELGGRLPKRGEAFSGTPME